MSDNFWYRTLFKIKLYETEGNSFQKLFSDIMTYNNPGFQPIKPWGNKGDGGNDGYIPDEEHYFQVYGPLATTNDSSVQACKKAQKDFEKLSTNYPDIQHYTFVHNDRFTGNPAPLQSIISSLQKEHNLESANTLSSGDLEQLFFTLSDDQKQSILGGVPSATPDFINPSMISELLTHLADTDHGLPSFLAQEAPDFSRKIQLNNISEPVSSFIKTNSYQVNYVDDFLQERAVELKGIIAEELKKIYNESKSTIRDEGNEIANLRYVWMVDKLIPEVASKNVHSLKAYREAAQIIIAKYFETCDAYEHPDELTS